MKKTLVSLALLGLAGVASAAPVALPFTASNATVPGITQSFNGGGQTWTSSELTGAYEEVVLIGAPNNVAASAFAKFSSFTGVTSFQSLLNFGYGIYATFTSNATQVSPTNFSSVNGSFQLWMDTKNDTTKALTGGTYGAGGSIATAPGVGTLNNSDDYLLASSSSMRVTGPFASYGNTNPPPSFEFTFDNFALTSADQDSAHAGNQSGSTFFIAPNPFHITVSSTGTVIGLNNVAGNQAVTGTLNLTFSEDRSLPEPESIALVGLGLLGMAAARRRKQA